MPSTESLDGKVTGFNTPRVVFLMGTARSGTTLLGTLLGEADDVFFAGELCDWAHLDGVSTVPRSQPFWEKVRRHIGPLPNRSSAFKGIFEHPAGIISQLAHRRERPGYERLTLDVLKGVVKESGRPVIVDSSHYPRRAQNLRRLLGPECVRLVFVVRRPSSVAQSFRKTGDKGVVQANLYMLSVSVLAWLTYVTHPGRHRAIVSYEEMIKAPLAVGSVALGQPLNGVDPYQMTPPLVLIANRFVKSDDRIRFYPQGYSEAPSRLERLSDLVQWPLRLADLVARSRSSASCPGPPQPG